MGVFDRGETRTARHRIREKFAKRSWAVVAWLAETARTRVQAATELQRHFDALYDSLGEEQRQMVDRRLMLSQTEPLGG